MTQYTVVTAPEMQQLIDNVNELMKDGYVCTGGISSTATYRKGFFILYAFYQAMIKDSASNE